jgi:hypothetical protein
MERRRADDDFQDEALRRMGNVEQSLAALVGRLDERCPAQSRRLDEVEATARRLEAAEHRRKGGMAVLAAMSGMAGALAAKFLER